MQKTKKRPFSGRLLSFAAAFATAVSAFSALPALPALKAQAAGSVTLSSDGTLTLSGAVTREQILAYSKNNSVKRVVAADDCVLPEDCSGLFRGLYSEIVYEDEENYEDYDIVHDYYWSCLVSVDLSKADASHVTTMAGMFANCDSNLESVDLSGLNTCNLECTASMFSGYNIDYEEREHGQITSLNMSGFQTSKVTKMSGMFCGCSALTSLDLSSFDTSNVTDMSYMFGTVFYGCEKLTALDLSSFDTSNVTDMQEMFCNCSSLTSLDLSSFDTSNVTNMDAMFDHCTALISLNLSSFDTSKVTSMKDMFSGCSSLTSLDLSSFDTANCSEYWGMDSMFYNCSSLTELDLSSFDTSSVRYMRFMFYDCSCLTTIRVSDLWNTNAVRFSEYMFTGCTNLVGGNGTAYDSSKTDKTYACIDKPGQAGYLTQAQAPGFAERVFDTLLLGGKVTKDQIQAWRGNSAVKSVVARDDCVLPADCSELFSAENHAEYWFNVASIDLSKADASRVTTMEGMFEELTGLQKVNLCDINTSKVTDMRGMFQGATGLNSLNILNIDTSKVTDMGYMFAECSALQSLNLCSFDTAKVTDTDCMFSDCNALTTIYVSDRWSMNAVSSSAAMFSRCSKLVGGNGTVYNSSKTGKTYARIDKPGQPGYLTGCTGSVTLSSDGTLTLSGEVTKDQVWAYRENSSVKRVVAADDCVLPADCACLFEGTRTETWTLDDDYGDYDIIHYSYWTDLISVDLSKADASRVTTMIGMFRNCDSNLKSVDLSGLNTCNLKSTAEMFRGHDPEELDEPEQGQITSLNLDGFQTSEVTDMRYMFSGCTALTSLDLSSFDTSKVTDMSYMFGDDYNGCKKLTALDLSSFDTSNVTRMAGMFENCTSLQSLDLSSFNTEKVKYMSDMFSYCSSLISVDLRSFDTANVSGYWDMDRMFYGCSSLTELDLSSFDTSKVRYMEYMFYDCACLTTIIVSDLWSTAAVRDSEKMFFGCENLTGGEGTVFDSSKTDKTCACIDSAEQPGYLTDVLSVTYELYISGTQVTAANAADILNNGVFRYNNADKTLHIRGNYTRNNYVMVRNAGISGLTVSTDKDSVLTSTDSLFYLGADTVFTGSGKLTLYIRNSGSEPTLISTTNAVNLTIRDCRISGDAGGKWGFSGADKGTLDIISSEVELTNTKGAVRRFTGITLDGCKIISPSGAYLTSSAVMTSDGIAKAVRIGNCYDLRINGTYVTEDNCADILGNGVFSYNNKTKTLAVKGSCSISGSGGNYNTNSMIESSIRGLKIDIQKYSVLKSDYPTLRLLADTTLTGSGRLLITATSGAGISVENGAALTVSGLTLGVISQITYGIAGTAGSQMKETLSFWNSSAAVQSGASTIPAVYAFKTISLGDCSIVSPTNGVVTNGCIAKSDGSTASYAEINKLYGLKIAGTEVTRSNKSDILGDGVFSYDPAAKTLHIHGDCSYSGTIIDNDYYNNYFYGTESVEGLTVCTDSESTLNAGSGTCILSARSLTMTGEMLHLRGSNGVRVAFSYGCYEGEDPDVEIEDIQLTLNEAAVDIQTEDEAIFCSLIQYISDIAGGEGSVYYYDKPIIINSSEISAESQYDAAFIGDLSLSGCSIVSPANAVIKCGYVNYLDDYVYSVFVGDDYAKKVVISAKTPISAVTVSLSKTEFPYTGSAVKVGSYLSVKYNGTPLTYGTDFTTSYANNTNCGYQTASVTVKGKGNYTGSVTLYYSILPKKQAAPTLSMDGTALHVAWTADSNAQGYQVQYCKDSTFTGSTLHTVSYTGKTSCTLSTYPKLGETWYVRVRSYITDGSGTKRGIWSDTASKKLTTAITSVTLSKTQFAYTGSAVKVGSFLTVKCGDTKLTYGTDYTTSYSANTAVGYQTAKVTVKGTGKYSGTFTKKYTIYPKKQAKPALSMSGTALHVEWTADSSALGYELEYCQNSSFSTTDASYHTVTYTGKNAVNLSKYPKLGETWYVRVRAFITNDGKTSGTKYGAWSDAASRKLTAAITSVTLSKTEFNYTGSAIKVGSYLSVMYGDTKLTYGTDYTTTYTANKNCGVETASVTVKGIGKYSGTFTKKFTIVPAKQAKPTLTAVSGGFKAEWTADSNAIGYELVYCKNSSFTGDSLHSCVYTATSAKLTKYPATGEKWYVKVRAVISSNGTTSGTLYGTYSAVASVTAG